MPGHALQVEPLKQAIDAQPGERRVGPAVRSCAVRSCAGRSCAVRSHVVRSGAVGRPAERGGAVGGIPQPDGDVLGDRQPREQVRGLGDQTHSWVGSGPADFSVRGRHLPGQEGEQGRLAGAAGAEQGEHRAGGEVEVDAAQHLTGAAADRHAVEVSEESSHRRCPSEGDWMGKNAASRRRRAVGLADA